MSEKNIYWNKYKNNLTGRDPLGIQAINIQLYSSLIPGVTNVTDRLRYYSFYPWIFDLYVSRGVQLEVKTYIRRAEFLFGLISFYHHKNDIDRSEHMVGTEKMPRAIEDLENSGYLKLTKYTDTKDSEFRYFKNQWGGFGQYYIGVLKQLGILSREKSDKNKYTIKLFERGSRLAESFNTQYANMFIGCVTKDSVSYEDLKTLTIDLCACGIQKNTEEYSLLYNYLFSTDDYNYSEQIFNRRDTINILLNILTSEKKPGHYWEILNALFFGYSKNGIVLKIPDNLMNISFCWKYYLLHEYFCLSLLGIYSCLKDIIGNDKISSMVITKKCWERYIIKTNETDFRPTLKMFYNQLKKNKKGFEILGITNQLIGENDQWFKGNIYNEYNISNSIEREHAFPKIFVESISLLFLVLARYCNLNEREIKAITKKLSLSNYPINLNKLKNDYDAKWINCNVQQILYDIIELYILRRHIDVAFKKLYVEGISTFRIYKESDCYSLSELDFNDIRKTSPRIKNLLQILADLQIVKEMQGGYSIHDIN